MNRSSNECVSLNPRPYSFSIFSRFPSISYDIPPPCIITQIMDHPHPPHPPTNATEDHHSHGPPETQSRPEDHAEKQQEAKEEEGEAEAEDGVNFDTFDQFEDAPNEPEEQPAREPEAEASQSEQPQQERQHLQHEPSESHQQQHNESNQQHNPPSNHEIQEKPHQPQEPNKQVSAASEQPNPPISSPSKPPSNPLVPTISSTLIIREAEQERTGSTFSLFLKYNVEYQKTVSSYRLIVRNVRAQLGRKVGEKRELHVSLVQYFEAYVKLHREFFERSAKVQRQQSIVSTTNKLANIKEELKAGFEVLFDVRKTLTDEMRKLENYIMTYTFKALFEAFEAYKRQQAAEEKRQEETIDRYEEAEKSFMKVFVGMEKLFKKAMAGERTKEDLFVAILRFANQETEYREALIKYGKTLLDFKKTFVAGEKELFTTLERILNEFKLESRKVFAAKKEDFRLTESYQGEVQAQACFRQLCTITDVDYIRSVLELQNRKECVSLTDDHFSSYLELPFFDRFVGSKKDLFKGTINKTFPLQHKNQELVHTISGNLVHFNRETNECKDKFCIKNLNARVFAEGAVELDEVVKGVVFSENRTVRVKLQNQDRAEELICYLNEKEEWKGGRR